MLTLCHDERLRPCGNSPRVPSGLQGRPRPVTAGGAPLADGMVIKTRTPELEEARRPILRMLARRYPAEAAQQFPDKEFHLLLRRYGVEAELTEPAATHLSDDSHPYIRAER